MKEVYNEISKLIDEERVLLNEPMSKHTTFRIGGPADLFVKVQNLEELEQIIKICNEKNIPLTVIGNGSNVLVKDEELRDYILKKTKRDPMILPIIMEV